MLTVRKKMKNTDPMKPPRTVIFPSVASSSLNSCIAAKVRIESAAEDTNEYGVGSASRNEQGKRYWTMHLRIIRSNGTYPSFRSPTSRPQWAWLVDDVASMWLVSMRRKARSFRAHGPSAVGAVVSSPSISYHLFHPIFLFSPQEALFCVIFPKFLFTYPGRPE